MATMTVDCGSFDKYSYNGATAYGTLVNFYIPDGATITGCSVSFTTHASGGNTADRAFSLNGARAHSGWASAGSLNAGLLRGGNNTFRVTLKSTTPGGYTVCWWNISGITLNITYNESGGGSSPPVGGGGPVVISPSSINAGAGSVTVTCPAEAGIWHMIDWTFGSKSGSWSHPWETGGTHALNIPLSWIEEIPNKTSGTLAIRVRRSTTPAVPYSYATDKTTNVTIKVPASIAPTISSFTETLVSNGVTATIEGYVQGHSKVSLAITAAAGSYSSIKSYRITGGGLNTNVSSGTFGPFDLSGDITFTAEVTDTRGRSASRQVAINILPYAAVTAGNVRAYRSDALKASADEGLYATLRAKIIYSSLDGQNVGTIEGRVYEKGTTPPSYTPVTSDELTLFGGSFSIEKSYTAEIKISDLITSHVYTIDIPTGTVIIGITPDGDGISFGTYPEAGIVKSAWPIVAPGIPPNPSILHNSDFRNPVNQRGVSGSISTGTYFFDRWIRNSGTVTVAEGYLTLDSGAVIEQRIEGNLLAGVLCTVSFEIDSTIYTGTGVFPVNNGTVSVEVDGYPDITFGCATGYMFVLIPATSNTSIKRFKCEMGVASTLHLDPPADYGAELAKCQRYARKIHNGVFRLDRYVTSTLYFTIPTEIPMRILNPTVVSGDINIYTWAASSVLQSGFSVGTVDQNAGSILLRANKTSHGLTDAWGSPINLLLSADL